MKKLGICMVVLLTLLVTTTGALAIISGTKPAATEAPPVVAETPEAAGASTLMEPQTVKTLGCTWGMTADQVRELWGTEAQRKDTGDGRSALVYVEKRGDTNQLTNFMFYENVFLYNISHLTIGGGYQDAYDEWVQLLTEDYGAPSTDAGDGSEAGTMIAELQGDEGETGFKGWKLDPLTIAVLSKVDATESTYMEVRMKTFWGIGLDTLTTDPFSVDGIRFGDSAQLVSAIEQPDGYAGEEDAVTLYLCLNRTFVGHDAKLFIVFDDAGVSSFNYQGDGTTGDFFASAMGEIITQFGMPKMGSDAVSRWEIEPGVTCELYLDGDNAYVSFVRSVDSSQ